MHIYLKLRANWMPGQYPRANWMPAWVYNQPWLPIQTTSELDASMVLTGPLNASASSLITQNYPFQDHRQTGCHRGTHGCIFHGQVHQIVASDSFHYSCIHVSPQANHIQSRKPSGQTHPFKSYTIHILHSRSISSFMYALQAKHIHSCTFMIKSCENIYNHTFSKQNG